MARRKGVIATVSQMQADAQRQQNARVRAEAERIRAQIAYDKATQLAAQQAQIVQLQTRAAQEREKQERRNAEGNAKVARMTAVLEDRVSELKELLHEALKDSVAINPDEDREPYEDPVFDPGPLGQAMPAPLWDKYCPPPPSGLSKLLPNAQSNHATQYQKALWQFQRDFEAYTAQEAERQRTLAQAWDAFQWQVYYARLSAQEHNAGIDQLKRDLADGVEATVNHHYLRVLSLRQYPWDTSTGIKVNYLRAAKQLVVEIDFSGIDFVPEAERYVYDRVSDEVRLVLRPQQSRKELYEEVLRQFTLIVLHDAYDADLWGNVSSVAFNGFVETMDYAVGRMKRVCVVSLLTTRQEFCLINLALVVPTACLKRLAAAWSSDIIEGIEVPVVTPFTPSEMQENVSSSIETTLNLMALDPIAFEQLIAELFTSMGLETHLTKASHDGGIDCIAYDRRPIIGGEIVIQAKRYSHTVGVSVVRDLYGALQDRRASKGIVVTTSSYGPDAYKFVADKPLELIDGIKLVMLLRSHMGLEAVTGLH